MLLGLSSLGIMPIVEGCSQKTDGSTTGSSSSNSLTSENNEPETIQAKDNIRQTESTESSMDKKSSTYFDAQTPVFDVMDDALFGDYGRLLFPVTGYHAPDASTTLETLGEKLTWYNYYNVDTTIDVLSFLAREREAGRHIFYPIYDAEEMNADPSKLDTGLFYFRAQGTEEPQPFAICNAGGGFSYVAAIHDSFPQALTIARSGNAAFALIYRPNARTACEDLARAITWIIEHADELNVDAGNYSLWGGSAGARMAAWLGDSGTEAFGEKVMPRPHAVVMQYTGLSEYSPSFEPPTYACCGTADWIADWRVMKERLEAISTLGVPTKFESFEGLPHGFGLGVDTIAEGWINNALTFWKEQKD